VSWFRSSQRKPRESEPSEAPPRTGGAKPDEDAAEAAGLEPLSPPAIEAEPESGRDSPRGGANAPLDFFSLDPLDDDWGPDEEEEEEEEEEEARPAKTPSRRGGGRSRERGPRASAAGGGLGDKPLAELHALAREAGIERYRLLRRPELIARLEEAGAGARTSAPREKAPPPARRDGSRERGERGERGGRRRGGRGRGGRDSRDSRDSRQASEPRGRRGREAPREASPAAREDEQPEAAPERLEGLLEVMADGFGFLRVEAPLRSDRDPHLSRDQVERFGLRAGDRVAAMARAPRRSERNPSVIEILEVNGQPAAEDPERPEDFSGLAALPPAERLPLSNSSAGVRMLEVVTPLGKGQRALVEGPGGAGATRLLHDIASGLSESPVHVVAAVIDARPEELWAWQSSGSELFATTAEDAPADQVRGAVLALERSKRLVEEGAEVVLIVDSLTRLARAYGLAGTRGGTEGDSGVHEAKRLFAAARRTDRGSLTIVAAARSDGTAAADDELTEALAQIANVELRLDSVLADAGLFPAIDVGSSRTRGEDALIDPDERARLDALRGPARALEGEEAWRYLAEQLEE